MDGIGTKALGCREEEEEKIFIQIMRAERVALIKRECMRDGG